MTISISAGAAIAVRAEDIPLARRIAAFAMLLCADFFYGWAWNSVDLLRPYVAATLDLSLTQAGSGYTAQSAGALIGAVIIGQLADRWGRRTMLTVVVGGYALALLAGSLVQSYAAMLADRFVLGGFMGGMFPVVLSLYVSWFHPRIRGKLAACYNATFSAASIGLGIVGRNLTDLSAEWRDLLVIGAVPALLVAVLIPLVIPDDRRTLAFGTGAEPAPFMPKLPVRALFAPGLRGLTLRLVAMIGLNFFGYQAFNGWLTTYLRDVRHFDDGATLDVTSALFAVNIVGGFAWGAVSDRFGRRRNAGGYLLAAGLILVFLSLPSSPVLLAAMAAAYGFCLSASTIWGPWISELYPQHLRATAGSIFNWGRIISLFAPLVTGGIAELFRLPAAMALGSVSLAVAALIWWSLPETLPPRPAGRR